MVVPGVKSWYLLIRVLQRNETSSEPEQEPMVPCTLTTSSACLVSVENFSQRVSLIREVRNVETKENSQRGLNSKNVVTKHGQGPLVLSQGP